MQAQNLLGQLYYQRRDFARAVAAEEIVVATQSQAVLPRRILANSYLQLKQWEKAREYSQWLVDKGGSEGASARLILGQALAGLQKTEAAIEALTAYLDGDPASSVGPQIRQLLTQLKARLARGRARSCCRHRSWRPGT